MTSDHVLLRAARRLTSQVALHNREAFDGLLAERLRHEDNRRSPVNRQPNHCIERRHTAR